LETLEPFPYFVLQHLCIASHEASFVVVMHTLISLYSVLAFLPASRTSGWLVLRLLYIYCICLSVGLFVCASAVIECAKLRHVHCCHETLVNYGNLDGYFV